MRFKTIAMIKQTVKTTKNNMPCGREYIRAELLGNRTSTPSQRVIYKIHKNAQEVNAEVTNISRNQHLQYIIGENS